MIWETAPALSGHESAVANLGDKSSCSGQWLSAFSPGQSFSTLSRSIYVQNFVQNKRHSHIPSDGKHFDSG